MTLKSIELLNPLVIVYHCSLNIDWLGIWHLANFMKFKLYKMRVIFSYQKYQYSSYLYTLGNFLTLKSNCVKDLKVHNDCVLNAIIPLILFFSHAVKLLGLICAMT
jgi:hypothetical protein